MATELPSIGEERPMKYILQLFLFILLCSCLQAQAATTDDRFITVNLPQPLIQDSIERVLPLLFSVTTDQVEGIITIEKISDLQLKDQLITAKIRIHGDNMTIKTVVAKQEIRIKLGAATTDFNCDAALRYDSKQQTLFIRPLPRESKQEQSFKEGNIGEALLILLNGREFPLELDDIEPIIAETNTKTITIHTRIADIRSAPKMLQLKLEPDITTKP
jgi:hypothetical protein